MTIECPGCVNGMCDTNTAIPRNASVNPYYQSASCRCNMGFGGTYLLEHFLCIASVRNCDQRTSEHEHWPSIILIVPGQNTLKEENAIAFAQIRGIIEQRQITPLIFNSRYFSFTQNVHKTVHSFSLGEVCDQVVNPCNAEPCGNRTCTANSTVSLGYQCECLGNETLREGVCFRKFITSLPFWSTKDGRKTTVDSSTGMH